MTLDENVKWFGLFLDKKVVIIDNNLFSRY